MSPYRDQAQTRGCTLTVEQKRTLRKELLANARSSVWYETKERWLCRVGQPLPEAELHAIAELAYSGFGRW